MTKTSRERRRLKRRRLSAIKSYEKSRRYRPITATEYFYIYIAGTKKNPVNQAMARALNKQKQQIKKAKASERKFKTKSWKKLPKDFYKMIGTSFIASSPEGIEIILIHKTMTNDVVLK